MNGKKAKKIRRAQRNSLLPTTNKDYFIKDNGQILSDRNRRTYQMRKEQAVAK